MKDGRWREADLMDYLDGRLSPEKRAALQADIIRDPALRLEVKQLEQTVAFTRAVPLREAPRNYLLTPAMVAGPERTKSQPARSTIGAQRRPLSLLLLRLTTAVMAVAFVVTVGLNLWPGTLGMGGATGKVASDRAASPQEEAMFMVAEATPQASPTRGVLGTPPSTMDETEAPNEAPAPMRMMQTTAEPTPKGDLAEASAPEAALTPPVSQQEAVKVEELPPGMAPPPGAVPEGGGIGGAAEVPAMPMQTTQGLSVGHGTVISDTAEGEVADRGITETSESEQPLMPPPNPSETEPLSPVRPRRAPRQRWWLPGILGVITLLLGGATWWLSRRGA